MVRKQLKTKAPTFSERFLQKAPDLVQAEFLRLPPEERMQFAHEIAKISASLGFTADEAVAFAMVSNDGCSLESSARDLHARSSLALLMTSIDCSVLREKKHTKQFHGCPTQAAYRRAVDQRINMSAARFSILATSGDTYRLRHEELLQGVDGEPGIPLEVLARSITKLSVYEDVRARIGAQEAIKAITKYSFTHFKALAHTDEPWVKKTAADAVAEQGAAKNKQTAQPSTKAPTRVRFPEPQTENERKLLHGLQHGYDIHIVSSERPDALDGIELAVQSYRAGIDARNREHFGGSPLGLETSFPLNDDLLTSFNGLDLEECIRKGFTDMSVDRRTLAILVARLRYEDQFRPRWDSAYGSFSDYARVVLGIGEELRDILRVGRNLLRYPFFLEGQEGFDTDKAYYSLRHLDQAMQNHDNDSDLIRARILSLTIREFAEFARDPHFDEHGSKKRLTQKQEERYCKLLDELNGQISLGRSVKVVEILTKGELAIMATFIRNAEARLARRDAEDRAGAFIAPIADFEFHPMDEDVTTITADRERVLAAWAQEREELLEDISEFIRRDGSSRDLEEDWGNDFASNHTAHETAEVAENSGIAEALRLTEHEGFERDDFSDTAHYGEDGKTAA